MRKPAKALLSPCLVLLTQGLHAPPFLDQPSQTDSPPTKEKGKAPEDVEDGVQVGL